MTLSTTVVAENLLSRRWRELLWLLLVSVALAIGCLVAYVAFPMAPRCVSITCPGASRDQAWGISLSGSQWAATICVFIVLATGTLTYGIVQRRAQPAISALLLVAGCAVAAFLPQRVGTAQRGGVIVVTGIVALWVMAFPFKPQERQSVHGEGGTSED